MKSKIPPMQSLLKVTTLKEIYILIVFNYLYMCVCMSLFVCDVSTGDLRGQRSWSSWNWSFWWL